MTELGRLNREYLRAPVRRKILYVDDGFVQSGKAINISEGGILLGELPHIPPINVIHMMIDLPQFPDFHSLGSSRLSALKLQHLERKIIRIRARIVRSFEGKSEVEMAFKNIGCEFVDFKPEIKGEIEKYVSRYARNIIYMLMLFEHIGRKKEQIEELRNLCYLLGYNWTEKVPFLRQKILHDYQSLESL